MENIDKTRLKIQERSSGDGMENTSYDENTSSEDFCSTFSQPDETKFSKNFALLSSKKKEPKFVPYEPYKAAVSPMLPSSKKCEKSVPIVIDSQKVSSLASSVIQYNSCKKQSTQKPVDNKLKVDQCQIEKCCSPECCKKLDEVRKQISVLEEQKKELESQFKIQTEVNADLKKMLVAALGEDMQVKVQYMTEDKARLGLNVLQCSEEMHQKDEEIERLSVQCDVWKSKFEASSVMVDELARWKTVFTEKLHNSINAINYLLKDHEKLSNMVETTFKHLKITFSLLDPTVPVPNPGNLLQLAKECETLAINIQTRLFSTSHPKSVHEIIHKRFILPTPAQQFAFQVMENIKSFSPIKILDLDDFKHFGPGRTACAILPHECSREPTVKGCKHCSGEMIQI